VTCQITKTIGRGVRLYVDDTIAPRMTRKDWVSIVSARRYALPSLIANPYNPSAKCDSAFTGELIK